MRTWILLLALIAQDYSRFEVASVRPSPPANLPAGMVPAPNLQGGPGTADPERIAYTNAGMRLLIETAFGVRFMQVVAPAWTAAERYDVSAKVPAGASKEQFQTMFQTFLKERFKLQFHHEERMLPVYAMTVGKNGPKLKVSTATPDPLGPVPKVAGADDDGFPVFPPAYVGVAAIPANGRLRIRGQKVGVEKLAQMLQDRLDHPIVDQTGLTGEYDFKVEIEWIRRPGPAPDGPSDPAPSVSQALDKLGLKLELKRLPYDVIVVDQIDKVPTAN